MSLVRLPAPLLYYNATPQTSLGTINAVGESRAAVGHVMFEGGPASAKVLSSAGGAVLWNNGIGGFFASGSTNFRIGIQDVGSTGLEDGTYDVQANLVPGVESLTDNAWHTTLMESGTKTISYGQLIAIVFEMTARGGSDDVRVRLSETVPADGGHNWDLTFMPHGTQDVGSGVVRAGPDQQPIIMLKFNDGTYGWLAGCVPHIAANGSASQFIYDETNSPDEYAAVFSLPFRAGVSDVMLNIQTNDDFDINVWKDPWGTPVAIPGMPVTYDPATFYTGTGQIIVTLPTSLDVRPNIEYAVSLRSATATLRFGYFDLGSGYDLLKRTLPFATIKMAARTNQTGPFVETQTYHTPLLGLFLSHLGTGV